MERAYLQVQEHLPVLSLEGVIDPIKAERLNEPHLWQCGYDVHREALQGTHNDGDKPVHLHHREQKFQGRCERDLALVLFCVITELLQRVGAQVLQQSLDRAVHHRNWLYGIICGKLKISISSWVSST